MINNVLHSSIEKHNPTNILELKNAIKEVMQNIILCGLARGGFFNDVVFYGGTSLRIFHSLPRFSEDLDFVLCKNDKDFNLSPFLNYALDELKSYMIEATYLIKDKTTVTSVESASIKINLAQILSMTYAEYKDKINKSEQINIKVDVETNFIDGGKMEIKLISSPSFAQIRIYDLSTLFSSKLMAILNRNWKNRVKGRDYYDYLFYISNNIKINMDYIKRGLYQSKIIESIDDFTLNDLRTLLKNRFEKVNFDDVKSDIMPFILANDRYMASLDKDIFYSTLDILKIV